MSPDPNVPATSEEVERSAEAAIAATAVTLETLQEAIESEAEVSQERQEELLQEVRECRNKLEALSTSIVGAENPATQQMLVQMGQLQVSVEAIQADLAALTAEEESVEESPEEQSENTTREAESRGSNSAPNALPNLKKEENATSPKNAEQSRTERPESSPSPTPPKKKKYVKI